MAQGSGAGRSAATKTAAAPPAGAGSCGYAAVVSPLTLEQIAAKIATAEAGLAAATTDYDRNVFAQIRDEYRRYAAERTKQIAKAAAASNEQISSD